MYNFEKLNKLSINIYELGFDENKYKLIPNEISKNESDKVIDLLIYKNHYVLIKKLNVFIGKRDCRYVGRKCLNSYTNNSMSVKHKKLCKENQQLKILLTHIYIGRNIFKKINYILEYMQTSKLIIKKKIIKLETNN